MVALETPQEYLDYFQSCALDFEASDVKWTFGLQAAQLWKTYHDTADHQSHLLRDFVHVLMPYRYSGSGFHALWLTFLNHLKQLPVNDQIAIWLVVFDVADQGDRLIDQTAVGKAILGVWEEIENRGASAVRASDEIVELAEAFGSHKYHAYEWIALASAIDHWFSARIQEARFMDAYLIRYKQS